MADRNEAVRVVVRVRPLSEKEKQDGRKMCVALGRREGAGVPPPARLTHALAAASARPSPSPRAGW